MSSSLGSRTVGALKWSLVQEVAQKLLQFGIGVLMARLLSPHFSPKTKVYSVRPFSSVSDWADRVIRTDDNLPPAMPAL